MCVWFAVIAGRANRQRDAVSAFMRLEARCRFDDELNGRIAGTWLSGLIDRHLVENVTYVDFDNNLVYGRPVTNTDLLSLSGLPKLEYLSLSSCGIGDEGLANVSSLSNLKQLTLNATHVSNNGLRHLKGLSNLERLDFSSTDVGDDGLAHLTSVPQLKALLLRDTKLSDNGMPVVARFSTLLILDVSGTQVSNSGLVALKRMARLERLMLNSTGVEDGVHVHLSHLSNLEIVEVRNTNLTDEGIALLKRSLPHDCTLTYKKVEGDQQAEQRKAGKRGTPVGRPFTSQPDDQEYR